MVRCGAVDPGDAGPELAGVEGDLDRWMNTISAKTAYMPIPASTDATSAILISATMMPSIITSSIDHISK
jgi:hypothetical protein